MCLYIIRKLISAVFELTRLYSMYVQLKTDINNNFCYEETEKSSDSEGNSQILYNY